MKDIFCSFVSPIIYRFLIFLVLISLVDFADGQVPREPLDDLSVVRQLGVELTEDGVSKFFNELLKDKSLSDKEVDALIAQLVDTFVAREQAVKRLATLPDPPVDKLRAAATSEDFEVAHCAKTALLLIANRQDPRAAVFRLIRAKQVNTDPKLLLQVIAILEDDNTFSAALETFAGAINQGDKQLIENSLKDERTRVVAAAVRVLPELEHDNTALVQKLRKWLEHENSQIQMAAARALVTSGESLDFEKFAKLLDAQSLLIVLRIEEERFREENKDNRKNRELMTKYQKILNAYAETLVKTKNATREKKRASRNEHWKQQGLDTSKHPELLMYRIKWLNGRWSGWFVPGFNDRETSKGRDIRYWACFNDHEHETIVTTKKAMYRKIQDLP